MLGPEVKASSDRMHGVWMVQWKVIGFDSIRLHGRSSRMFAMLRCQHGSAGRVKVYEMKVCCSCVELFGVDS